jgi:hypothetical protein
MQLSRAKLGLRRVAFVLAVVVTAPLATARADTATLATEPDGAISVVLWNGGVAWWGHGGIRFAAPGSSPRLLAPFPEYAGPAYDSTLDGGAGAGPAGGVLAYGWNEVNEQTPPMGPGDTEVPAPAIPYGTNVLHRGLVAAAGGATKLPDCGVAYAFGVPNQEISLAGGSLAYACGEPSAMPGKSPPTYVAVANVSAPGTPQSKLPEVNGEFQVSGNFAAFDSGEYSKPGKLIVKNLATNSIAYEVPPGTSPGGGILALQEDGSLVVLGRGTSACAQTDRTSTQSYPTEWFPVAGPVAHQLGCFYDGALRPVGGKWVALAPGPGSQASLVLVDLATGSRRTLAVLPDPGMFEPQQQPLFPAADFDGTRLAWAVETCAGVAVQLTPDVNTMTPGPPPSNSCPVRFHIHRPLRAKRNGNVRVSVSCPLGCRNVVLAIRRPRALANEFAGSFSLPASPKQSVESFHLSRDDRAYVRRHRRVRITLGVQMDPLGGGNTLHYTAHATLVG